MCGIAGIVSLGAPNLTDLALESLEMVRESLNHRGPDASGLWVDRERGVALAHTRLSILDVSDHGAQPMISRSGRYVVTYNGETYNHLELRSELSDRTPGVLGAAWVGNSDTETILAAFDEWGITNSIPRFVGMFAMAIWDRLDQALYLVRDRFGEKPLIYGWITFSGVQHFVYSSELKAINAIKSFQPEIDREAVQAYLSDMYIRAPRTIYQNIFKLLPGTLLKLKSSCLSFPVGFTGHPGYAASGVTIQKWYDYVEVASRSKTQLTKSIEESISLVEENLFQAVRRQTISDVPIGALLSGGVDSSLVVSTLQATSRSPIKTFTVGYQESDFDESGVANEIASILGTDHTTLDVTPTDALDVIRILPRILDEPFADSSIIPTFLISRLASENIKVALTGDGGDEIFGGYTRYRLAPRLINIIRRIPGPMRWALSSCIGALPSKSIVEAGKLALFFGAPGERIKYVPQKIEMLRLMLSSAKNISDVYSILTSTGLTCNDGSPTSNPPLIDNLSHEQVLKQFSEVELMMIIDALNYMSNDILYKVDCASMSNSLETRAPFLDHDLVEAAWSVPQDEKITKNSGKYILRRILRKYLPDKIIDKPKSGFAVPIGDWLRGPLMEWAEEMLSMKEMGRLGVLEQESVQRIWKEHRRQTADHTAKLWTIIVLESWLQNRCKG